MPAMSCGSAKSSKFTVLIFGTTDLQAGPGGHRVLPDKGVLGALASYPYANASLYIIVTVVKAYCVSMWCCISSSIDTSTHVNFRFIISVSQTVVADTTGFKIRFT